MQELWTYLYTLHYGKNFWYVNQKQARRKNKIDRDVNRYRSINNQITEKIREPKNKNWKTNPQWLKYHRQNMTQDRYIQEGRSNNRTVQEEIHRKNGKCPRRNNLRHQTNKNNGKITWKNCSHTWEQNIKLLTRWEARASVKMMTSQEYCPSKMRKLIVQMKWCQTSLNTSMELSRKN